MSRDVPRRPGIVTTAARYLALAVVAWLESLVRPDLREHVPGRGHPR